MATHIDTVAQVEDEDVGDGLVTGTPTGGTGRFAFGASQPFHLFSGVPTIADMKYGGSGGTSMTALGAQITGTEAVHAMRGYYVVGGPSASTDIFSDITTIAPQQVSIGAQFYEGVDAGTPYSDYTTTTPAAITGVTSTTASIVIPNCIDGQTVVACVVAYHVGNNASLPTAFAGTTLGAAAIRTDAGINFISIAMLRKVQSGSGSCTLQVTLNNSSSDDIAYLAMGMRLNDAAGGGGNSLAWIRA